MTLFSSKITLLVRDKCKHIYFTDTLEIAFGKHPHRLFDYYYPVQDRCTWFHVKGKPSPHVILYNKKDPLSSDSDVHQWIKGMLTQRESVIYTPLDNIILQSQKRVHIVDPSKVHTL